MEKENLILSSGPAQPNPALNSLPAPEPRSFTVSRRVCGSRRKVFPFVRFAKNASRSAAAADGHFALSPSLSPRRRSKEKGRNVSGNKVQFLSTFGSVGAHKRNLHRPKGTRRQRHFGFLASVGTWERNFYLEVASVVRFGRLLARSLGRSYAVTVAQTVQQMV